MKKGENKVNSWSKTLRLWSKRQIQTQRITSLKPFPCLRPPPCDDQRYFIKFKYQTQSLGMLESYFFIGFPVMIQFCFFRVDIRVEVATRKHLGSAKGLCLPGCKRTTRIVCQAYLYLLNILTIFKKIFICLIVWYHLCNDIINFLLSCYCKCMEIWK